MPIDLDLKRSAGLCTCSVGGSRERASQLTHSLSAESPRGVTPRRTQICAGGTLRQSYRTRTQPVFDRLSEANNEQDP